MSTVRKTSATSPQEIRVSGTFWIHTEEEVNLGNQSNGGTFSQESSRGKTGLTWEGISKWSRGPGLSWQFIEVNPQPFDEVQKQSPAPRQSYIVIPRNGKSRPINSLTKNGGSKSSSHGFEEESNMSWRKAQGWIGVNKDREQLQKLMEQEVMNSPWKGRSWPVRSLGRPNRPASSESETVSWSTVYAGYIS